MSDVEVLLVPVASDSPDRTPDGIADDFHWRSKSKESPKFTPQWQGSAPEPPTFFAQDDGLPSEPVSPTSPISPPTSGVRRNASSRDISPGVRGTRIRPGSACTSDLGSTSSYGSRALSPLRFDPLDAPSRHTTTVMLPVLLDAQSNTDTMVDSERSSPSSWCTGGSMTAASSSAPSAAWNYNKIMNLDMLDAGSGNITPMILSGTSTPGGVAHAVVKAASRPGTAKRWQETPVADASRTATSSMAKVEIRSRLGKLGSDNGSGASSVVVDLGSYENFMPPASNTEVVGSVSGLTSQGSVASKAKPRDHQMDATMPGQPMDLAKQPPPASAPRASPESVGGASSLMSEQVASALFQREVMSQVAGKDMDDSNLGTTQGTTAFEGVDSTGHTWFDASKLDATVSGVPYLSITEEDFPDSHPMESVRTAGSFEEHVLAQFSEDLVPSECFTEKSEAGLESVRTEATYEERVLDALLTEVEDGIAPSVAADSVAEDPATVQATSVDEEVVSVQSLQWPESVRTAASAEERIVAALDDEFADLDNFDLSTPGQIDSVRTAASLEERILATLDLDVEVESRPPSQGYAGSVATFASLEERIVDTLDLDIDFGDSRPPSSSMRSVGTDATLEERIVASFDLLGSDEIDIALALRVVGTYVLAWGDDGRFKSRGEITQVEGSHFRWQDQDGQQWVVAATADPTIFDVGSDCPYYKEGFNQMRVDFDEVGNVKYVTGPTFPEGPHWEKKAYDPPIAGRYVPEIDEESEDVVVIESLGDNKFRWIHADLKRWVVTATVDPCVYNVNPACPYYHSGYKQMRVDFDKEGDIECFHGPEKVRWKKPSEPKTITEDLPPSEEPLAEPEVEPVVEPAHEPAAEPVAEEKPRRRPKSPITPEPEEPAAEWRPKARPRPKKLQEADDRPSTPTRKPSIPQQDVRWQVKPSPKRMPRIRHELGPDEMAEIHARRAVRLAYHRTVANPPVYQPYRRTAMAEDLAANDHSPSTWANSPEVMLKNRNTQRKAYMSLPAGAGRYLKSRRKTGKELATMEPIAELATSGEMDFARTSGGTKLPHIQSAPVLGTLGTAGKASLGTSAYSTKSSKVAMTASSSEKTRKLLKKYNAPDGLEMLRLLKEGRLPSLLCPPI